MEPDSAHESHPSKSVDADLEDEQQDPTDSALEPGPEVEDDGSVPMKQITRWKGEGGSWLPTD